MFPVMPDISDDHQYSLNGQPLPGVTSVLKAVGILDFSGMPPAIMEAAMRRGTNAHKATELDDAGELDVTALDPELMGYLLAWRAFRADLYSWGGDILPDWTERRMASLDLGYAGTMDRMVEMGGKLIPLDIKTGEVKRWCGVQLAAYDLCRGFCDSERWGVKLNKDGTYKLRKFNDRTDYATWLAALKVYGFINQGGK